MKKHTLLAASLVTLVGAFGTACGLGSDGDGDGPSDGVTPPPPPPVVVNPPPVDPPPPPPATYKRASVVPEYKLTPVQEYGRFDIRNTVNQVPVPMTDNDFKSAATVVSSLQRMDEISQTVSLERQAAGLPAGLSNVNIINVFEDENRATDIPMRGNPSDVDFVKIGGNTKIYVPLGGDIMTPNDEVAVFDTAANQASLIRGVGLRPRRLAIQKELGLVFVCNHYSNYISVIDAATDELLRDPEGNPVEIRTEYYCADVLITDRSPGSRDNEQQTLWVANEWRGTVIRYNIEILVDPITGSPSNIRTLDINGQEQEQANPTVEIQNVGPNPQRLLLSQDENAIFVFNSRGGDVARVNVTANSATRLTLPAPAIDAVQVNQSLFVLTMMDSRGLPAREEEQLLPFDQKAQPVRVNNQNVHPGSLLDNTKSYNFEDLRNGIYDLPVALNQAPSAYFTDDNDADANYAAAQKILTGSQPRSIVVNAARNRVFVAHSGSDNIQEIEVVGGGGFRLRAVAGGDIQTGLIPWALAINDDDQELYVVNWGGETLQRFDLANNNAEIGQPINLGYAIPAYPATNIELGEYLFQSALIGNDGRKSCVSCHFDEFLADGIPYANGATASTAYHKVIVNTNQFNTDNYFWNGTFTNGSYKSLAFAAQTRTNCEVILFGLVEGMTEDPDNRVGDPANQVTQGAAVDQQCRPQFDARDQLLPINFAQIAQIIADQKLNVANTVIQNATAQALGVAVDRDTASRVSDFYTLSELRVPPSPLKFMQDAGMLDGATAAKIEEGRTLFTSTTVFCKNCHNDTNSRAPFIDAINHGGGADWPGDFVDNYGQDPRVIDLLAAAGLGNTLPEQITEANNRIGDLQEDAEINTHLSTDYFRPFCLDTANNSCFQFDDPIAVDGTAREDDLLELITLVNLADPERGFVPGNVTGSPSVNTPSLRGIWWINNYLRHGLAKSIGEAILPPTSTALKPGEIGYAIDSGGNPNVHGGTSTMTAAQLEALSLYLETIN